MLIGIQADYVNSAIITFSNATKHQEIIKKRKIALSTSKVKPRLEMYQKCYLLYHVISFGFFDLTISWKKFDSDASFDTLKGNISPFMFQPLCYESCMQELAW